MRKISLVLLVLLGSAGVAQATIYEWVENGIPTYSDSPPSAESGMGGHFHGPYTEGGVQVSISRANPETLATNAASDTGRGYGAQILANEAKYGAKSGPNGMVAGYAPQVMSQALRQDEEEKMRQRVEAAVQAAPNLSTGGEANALLAARMGVPLPRGNWTVPGETNAIIAERLMRDTQ